MSLPLSLIWSDDQCVVLSCHRGQWTLGGRFFSGDQMDRPPPTQPDKVIEELFPFP